MTGQVLVPLVQSWPEIRADFSEHWWVYASMPFVAAFVGWSTKLLFLQMLYRPLKFVGIGPFGWQGIVPRRAGKVAATTIDLLTANLLRPEELIDRFDAKEALDELRESLTLVIDDIAAEVAELLRPGLWQTLPEAGRRAVRQRIHAVAPTVVEKMLADMRGDVNRYLDIKYLTVTTLVKNKHQLNGLMKAIGGDAMAFVRRSGAWFGFGIGLVQLVAWAVFHNPWIMPAFGFGVGLLSDWLALNMLFGPRERKRVLGLFPFQGLLHANRDQITRDYAKIIASDLFAPDILFDAVLNGPGGERLIDTIQREVGRTIDEQLGAGRSVVALAVGTQRYRELKETVARLVAEKLPETMDQAKDYAARAIGVEELIIDKMGQLTAEEYESILRPVFKDDETMMIMTGAVLGGLVGELQIQIIHLAGAH